MSLLELKNVKITIGGQTVVENISFTVEKGEVVSIIGPNGAGKTVLIRAILGLQSFFGSILIDGKPISNRLGIVGYVPQYFNFDKSFPITVSEFLSFGRPADKTEEQKICSELRLENLLNKKIGALSGGQMQKVLIAQALLKDPQLLILDEPTSGVDAEGTKNFYELIGHFNEKHSMAILLISHEVNMVYKLAQKVVCLNRNLVCWGEPHDVLSKETMAKLYQSDLELRNHHH